MREQEMANNNLILKAQVGSHLYGTETQASDKDYVGIFIPDKEYILGIRNVEQVEFRTNPPNSGRGNTKDDQDTVLYSLPKFVKLAFENNPNIIETFFIDDRHKIFSNEFGERLLKAYPFFISKKSKYRFLGYAISQKKKLLFKSARGSRTEYYDKFGYDVKFASHLIRLLTEGLDLLSYGKLTFPLANNSLIKDIKLGKFDKSSVLTTADELESLIEQVYNKSKLQSNPDYEAINKLQIDLLEDFWEAKQKGF